MEMNQAADRQSLSLILFHLRRNKRVIEDGAESYAAMASRIETRNPDGPPPEHTVIDPDTAWEL